MVGGTVLTTIERADKITLVVRGTQGSEARDVLHVDVELGADVEATDEVWWQAGIVYVSRGSRFERVFYDKPCRKVSRTYGHYHLPLN